MKTKYTTMVLVFLLTFAFSAGTGAANTNSQTTVSDDIKAYDGPIGSDHVLYGWKLALEKLDVAFTLNPNDKLAKKIAHLEERIAEFKAASNKKNEKAALNALEAYEEEENDIQSSASNGDNQTGLINAFLRIQKHQFILENLTNQNPDNPGLRRAYNNSILHWQNFAIKHKIDIENLTLEKKKHDEVENLTIEDEKDKGVTASQKEIKNEDSQSGNAVGNKGESGNSARNKEESENTVGNKGESGNSMGNRGEARTNRK